MLNFELVLTHMISGVLLALRNVPVGSSVCDVAWAFYSTFNSVLIHLSLSSISSTKQKNTFVFFSSYFFLPSFFLSQKIYSLTRGVCTIQNLSHSCLPFLLLTRRGALACPIFFFFLSLGHVSLSCYGRNYPFVYLALYTHLLVLPAFLTTCTLPNLANL